MALLAERLPADVGALELFLEYSLATAIFGGIIRVICTFYIHEAGYASIPGGWLSYAAQVGIGLGNLVPGKTWARPNTVATAT